MKRKLNIEKVPSSTLFHVRWEGGGELPAVLKGQWTTPRDAQLAIDAWMATKPEAEIVELMKQDEAQKRVAAK